MRIWVAAICISMLLAGCVSKSKSNLRARESYVAGQQQAMVAMQQAARAITVRGNVRNPLIPWSEDMTLAKAIVAAEYQGISDPTIVILLRNGTGTQIIASELLRGHDVPVQPGDIIELR